MNHEPRDAWTWVLGQLGLQVSPMENFEQLQTDMFFLAGNLPFSLFLFNPFAGPFRGMMQHICVCWSRRFKTVLTGYLLGAIPEVSWCLEGWFQACDGGS